MPTIKLTDMEMKYISLLEGLTGVTVMDCVIDEEWDRVIYLVKPGQVGLAVGRDGINVKNLRKFIGKDVEIVEYAERLEDLIRNSLFPARVNHIRVRTSVNGRKIVVVSVNPSEKGLAIGKGGRNIARARLLAKRYFGVDNVVIT